MKIPESNAVWIVNDTVRWSVRNPVGTEKIEIAESGKDGFDEFVLPTANYGELRYRFEIGKHYSIRLLCGGQEYALSTL